MHLHIFGPSKLYCKVCKPVGVLGKAIRNVKNAREEKYTKVNI